MPSGSVTVSWRHGSPNGRRLCGRQAPYGLLDLWNPDTKATPGGQLVDRELAR